MAQYGYDRNVDYTKKINEAIANQDYRSAAIYEQQRNEKVRSEGLTQYKTTSHYVDYLPRTDEINSGMDKLANAEPWQYKLEEDPAWQSMRKQILREADRGTQDAMAAYAAQTGGMPSTAAVGAAQQAGNYYRAQLADRIPELMQNDYSRYMQGREAQRADLSLLANIEAQRAGASLDAQQMAWQKEQAQIAQAMERWTTMGVADQSVAAILGVPVGTSTQSAAYQQWQQQQAELERQRQAELDAQDADYRQWQMQGTDREDAYNRAMGWISRGIMPSDAELAAAGIDKTQAQRAVYLAQAGGYSGGSASGGSSGRSSSGGGTRSSSGTSTTPKEETPTKQEPTIETGTGVSAAQYTQIEDELLMYLNQYRSTGSNTYYSRAKDLLNTWQKKLSQKQAATLLKVWQDGVKK